MISRAFLAPYARREHDLRIRHWPVEIASGRMTQAEADADISAWATIAEMIETRSAAGDSFAPLLAALARAEQRRGEALDAAIATDDTKVPALRDRFAAVMGIRILIESSARAVGKFDPPRQQVSLAA